MYIKIMEKTNHVARSQEKEKTRGEACVAYSSMTKAMYLVQGPKVAQMSLQFKPTN